MKLTVRLEEDGVRRNADSNTSSIDLHQRFLATVLILQSLALPCSLESCMFTFVSDFLSRFEKGILYGKHDIHVRMLFVCMYQLERKNTNYAF